MVELLRFLMDCEYLYRHSTFIESLPRPLIVPNRFDVKSDRRGVGSCGLKICQYLELARVP